MQRINLITQWYTQLPERLRQWLEIGGISLGLLVFVTLGNLAMDGSILAAIIFFGSVALITGIAPVRKWRDRRQARRIRQEREEWVRSRLGNQSWEEALASAPYDYARWPDGDSNHLIYDKATSEVVGQEWSPEDAELWILEQTLTQSLSFG